MNKEQRRKASIDQTTAFFNNYSSDWRLTKVLAIKKLVAQRYDFYADILPDIQHWKNQNPDDFIAQEIHNGLHHDAIAQCVQYVEDFFALMQATKHPDFFVRNIITYKAGTITENIKRYKPTRDRIIKDFFLPSDILALSHDKKEVIDAIDQLVTLVADQVDFYQSYWFFYNQYKHGLSIPLAGYGNEYDAEQIQKDKAGKFAPMVAVYDNKITKPGKNTPDTNLAVMIYGFTENVRPHISTLMKENNFLRLVHAPYSPDFSIDILVEQAYKTRACINVLKDNYMKYLQPLENTVSFQLPDVDYRKNNAINATITFRPEDVD